MFRLHELVRLKEKRKRIGRGGSRGGTSGHGGKGQTARSGGSVGIAFEGGQMPLARRLPKRGFNNAMFKKMYELVPLESLEKHFDTGATVDREALLNKGIIKGKTAYGIKVLANGALSKKLILHVHAISESAKKVVQAQGGEVHIITER